MIDQPLPHGEPRPRIPDAFLAAFELRLEPPAPPAVAVGAWVRALSTWHQVDSIAPFRSPLGGDWLERRAGVYAACSRWIPAAALLATDPAPRPEARCRQCVRRAVRRATGT